MVDLHCHLIYDTDDGAKTIENSVGILKEAYKAGFKEICCTPHYLENVYIKTKAENEKKLEEIRNKLKEENINIKLYLGNEIYITENIKELLLNEKITTIGKSNYILIEFPMNFKLTCAEEIVENLIYNQYNVILAHPERYKYIQKDIKYLDNFTERGVYLQGNYESLLGKYGTSAKKILKKLLKEEKITFLATDSHKENSTYTRMDKVLRVLRRYAKREYYENITEKNPQKILQNKKI